MSDDTVTKASTPRAETPCVLRLYVAGSTPRSSRAISNLKTICEKNLPGRYLLTVVDLYSQPERAREDQIIVAPTLIRQSPLPVRRVVGDMSNTDRVLAGLGLPLGLTQP